MSFSSRIWNVVRANLNALADGLARRGDPLADATDEELEAELARRQPRRVERPDPPRARAQAPRPQPQARQAKSSTASTGAPRPRPPDRRAKLYATLETPVGASLEVTKKNFRRLVLANHPDRFAGDPAKVRAATEKTKQLTAAWAELEKLLTAK